MTESYRERIKRKQLAIRSSPEFKRKSYVNKRMGLNIIIIWPFLLLFANFVATPLEKSWGVSQYSTYAVLSVIGIAIAGLYAEKCAQKNFDNKKNGE